MGRQLKNSSLASTRTTDPDLQYSDSSTETASTSMPAAHHQDSPFFRLPLELRYIIYNYAFDYRHHDSLWYQPQENFDPLLSLFHTSQQSRIDVQALVVHSRILTSASIRHDGLGMWPFDVYSVCDRVREQGTEVVMARSWLWFDEDAPFEFKFWKIMLTFTTPFSSFRPVTADIDLRRRTISLLETKHASSADENIEDIFEPLKDPSGLSVQALEKPLMAAIQAAGKSADSDGFTFDEIRKLVKQIALPGRGHFEKLDRLLGAPLLHNHL